MTKVYFYDRNANELKDHPLHGAEFCGNGPMPVLMPERLAFEDARTNIFGYDRQGKRFNATGADFGQDVSVKVWTPTMYGDPIVEWFWLPKLDDRFKPASELNGNFTRVKHWPVGGRD